MTEILTSAQMRAVERAAIDSGRVTGLALMERAGEGVLLALDQRWPDLLTRGGVARVLCGPGNNGGDGFVIARLLQDRGWRTEIVCLGAQDRLPHDARHNRNRLDTTMLDGTTLTATPFDGDLSIDALFGTGLTRPISDAMLQAWLTEHDLFTQRGGASVAVDIPSGLDADSGRVLHGPGGTGCAQSCLTVTFHKAKPGHYLAEGPDYCGALSTQDIGL